MSTSKRLWLLGLIIVAVVSACTGGVLVVSRYLADPTHPFLIPENGAVWIRHNSDVNLDARKQKDETAAFRTRFRVEADPQPLILTLRAMRAANVFIDGKRIFGTDSNLDTWKQRYQIDLTANVPPGEHELKIVALNNSGPPCILAHAPALNIATGPTWEAAASADSWSPAVSVDAYRPAQISRALPSAPAALLKSLPLLIPVFLLAFALSLVRLPWLARVNFTPGAYRWLLMGALVVLGANNMFKLVTFNGFDASGHVKYIEYILQNHRIPLPTEGWTMFQAPLYYLLSAPLYALAKHLFEPDRAQQALRLLTVLCGVAQVEIAYRSARYLFPSRNALQIIATTVAALLPMNVYMSQYVGNESLAAMFVGLVVMLALRFYYDPEKGRTWPALALLGFVLGLAWLSKLTAMFLMPPLALLVAHALWYDANPKKVRRIAAACALIFGTAFIVAGWYYARNYVVLGRAFWGGWELERGIHWWQDPGYRTLAQLIPTGEALVHPVYSTLVSFWDGFYSTLWGDGYLGGINAFEYAPHWNYMLMLSSILLGLIPSAAIILGVVSSIRPRREQIGLMFMTGLLALYIAMLLYGFFSLPFYCITKASYTMGLACCYGALAAAGYNLLTKNRILQALLTAALTTWAATVYASYFIIH